MDSADHIIHAKWLMTNDVGPKVLEDHAIVVKQGKIRDILPSATVNTLYDASKVTKLPYHLLMPGFINAHTHIGMNYFRGLGSDHALMDWLTQYMWPAEKRWLSQEFVHDASLFAMAEMVRSGTTCFNDMFYFGEGVAQAAERMGMRAFIGMSVLEFPTNDAQNAAEYLAKAEKFIERYKGHARITPTIAPHAPYTVSDDSFMRVLALAEEYDVKINLHVHETQDEIKQSLEQFKQRPIKRLHDLGFLSPRVLAIHSVHLNDEDLDILSITQPQIVHCPESNMKLASGICPIARLQALKLNVAIGTDSVASNNDLDILSELRTASFLAKVADLDCLSMPAVEVVKLATINGARALGIEHLVGSLAVGKAADMVAVNFDCIETLPVYDPLVQLVYSSNREQISDVWVAGEQLLKDRELTTVDEQELKHKARIWGQKIRENHE